MKWILVILAVLIAGFGGYMYLGQTVKNDQIEQVRKACIQRYEAMPQGKEVVSNVNDFCECQADSARQSSKEEIRATWGACNDKFLKPGLMKSCMAANAEINPDNVAGKGVNCQCFYDKLIATFGEETEVIAERRNQLTTQAFMACRQ